MKRLLAAFALLIVIVLGAFAVPSAAQAANTTITLLNPPANGELHLAVGESYTLVFEIVSDTPYQSAMAIGDIYYPGRGVTLQGVDRTGAGTSATLTYTITGKAGGTSQFPGGFNPATVNVAVRFGQNNNVVQQYPINVYVP